MRKLKKKKIPGDIILHKCTKNHDHMLYCSWDMVCDKCNFYFSFWANFCFFTLLKAWKFRIFKNEKKHPEISSLKTCTTNYDQIMYSSWDMVWKGRTDGQMDGKSDILRWVPHLKPFSWFESKLSKTSFSKGGIRPPPTLLGYSSALVSNKAALLLKPFE